MGLKSLERFREDLQNYGIRVHGNQFVKVGEKVVCIRDMISQEGEKIKGKIFEVLEIVVESQEGNGLGFLKRIKLSGYGDELFNPSRFRKV